MLFIFLFNLSGHKAFSFKTRKYSLRFKSILVSSVVVCFLFAQIWWSQRVVEIYCFLRWNIHMLKLRLVIQHLSYDYWDECWKKSHFFQRTEVGVYGIRVNKLGFHFCSKVVKYLKGFFCPVTLECFCFRHVFIMKTVQSWEA